MRVEMHGAVIPQPRGQRVQQGGVVRGGGGVGKLHTAAAGVQVPKVDAGRNARIDLA